MPPRKVLVADPDAGAAAQLATRLTRLGFTVTGTAATAEDTLRLAGETSPDVVLMDRALRASAIAPAAFPAPQQVRPIPIVLVIDAADEASVDQPSAPVDGHVVRPFTDRELRAAIELALCRHDARREARELEERFFAVSIDMLCFLDYGGYFRRLNPAWERTLGWTVEELTSRPFIEFVHPDDRERTLRQNAEVRAGGQALAFENRYLCRDGSYRWLLWNAAPDPGHRVIYSAARDITERKRLEEERERLVGELQAALAEVRALREILPVCSYCGKVRDDANYWSTVEHYLARHAGTRFSHGICPECLATRVEPELREWEGEGE